MVHRFAVFALLVATAEAGKKTCEQWCVPRHASCRRPPLLRGARLLRARERG